MKITFSETAISQLNYWITTKPRTAAKILNLLKDTIRTPFEGKGKPEALKHGLSGVWSRRIDKEHRLLYKATDNEIFVVSV